MLVSIGATLIGFVVGFILGRKGERCRVGKNKRKEIRHI